MAPRHGNHALSDGELDQIRIGLEMKLLHHAVFMEGHRARRDVEDLGRLLHGAPFRQELQDLALAGRQLRAAPLFARSPDQRLHHALGDQRGDIGAPAERLFDRLGELRGGGGLEKIPGCAGAEGFAGQVRVLVHGQKDELDSRHGLLDLPGRIQAIQERHGDVEHDHVGLEFGGRGEQGAPVGDGAHHRVIGLEQLFEGFEQERVIIGQKHAPAHQ